MEIEAEVQDIKGEAESALEAFEAWLADRADRDAEIAEELRRLCDRNNDRN